MIDLTPRRAYDESGHALGDYPGTLPSMEGSEYIYMDGLPVGVVRNGKLYYLETDHLGTPRQVIDPVRNVAVWKWDFLANTFGNSAPDQDPDGDGVGFVFPLRFAGQYTDAETGLNYSYQRDYESGTGRYGESDPTGQAGGINTYAYVDGSPLNGVDPDGLAPYFPGCNSGGCHSPPPVPFPAPGPKPAPAPSIPGFSLHPPPGFSFGLDVVKMCVDDPDEKQKKNCQALKDSILNTCYGLGPRARMRCFEAANTAFQQCMGHE